MKELLLYMAKNLVDSPDSVSVTEIEGETTVLEPIYWIICLFLSEFVEWLIRCHIIIRCCLKGGSMV